MKVSVPRGVNKKITESKDAYKVMHSILLRLDKIHRQREYFWVVGLDTSNTIMYIELTAIGQLNKVATDPVEIYSLAVGKKCKRIILVHNHPSTNVKPSEQDIRITNKLKSGGNILNIEILDHIIITEKNGYYSFADEELL